MSAWGQSWGASWGNSWGISDAVKTGHADDRPRRHIFKPSGLVDRPSVKQRIEETALIHQEVVLENGLSEIVIRQFAPVETMSLEDINTEIAALMKKKLLTDEEDVMLLFLLAATV